MRTIREIRGNISHKVFELGNELWTLFANMFIGFAADCKYVAWNNSATYTRLDCIIKSKAGNWSDIMSLQVMPSHGQSIGGKSFDIFAALLSAVKSPDDINLSLEFDRDNSRQYLSGIVTIKGIVQYKDEYFEHVDARKFHLVTGKGGEQYKLLCKTDNLRQEMANAINVESIKVDTPAELFAKIGKKIDKPAKK